jgi:hypothetical protein
MTARTAPNTRREFAAALGVLMLATLCCFHKLALHPEELLVGPQKHGHNDLVDYFLASREFAAQSIRSGEWPFWNPNLCLGLPYTGNAQSALYYPPNWLTLIWDPRYSLSWLLAAHHLFAGLGVYCLSRRHGLSWTASALGGIVFLGAPFLIAQAAEGHYPQICAVAWIPWAFLAYERFRDARTVSLRNGIQAATPPGGIVLMVAVLAACFFCGHPQETYYLVLLLTGCLIANALACCRRGDRAGGGALCLGWVQCGCYTAGIVAIDLVPTYLATLRTARPGLQQQASGFGWTGMSFDSLRELIDPFVLTRPELWQPGTTPFWEKLFHFGVLPLVLAAAGIALGSRRGPAHRLALLWIVTVAFAFGARGDLYNTVAGWLPGLGWFREPSRILFFTSFATACLAACGWDALQRRATRWTGHASVCNVLSAVMIVLCTGELARFAGQVTDTATVRPLDERNPELAALLATAAPGQRVLAPQEVLSDSDAVQLRLPKVSGYEPAGPLAYLMVNSRLQGSLLQPSDPMGFLPADPLRMDRKWLELLGVRYAVRAGKVTELPDGWQRVGAFQLSRAVHRRGEQRDLPEQLWEVFELETALLRACVVGSVTEVGRFSEFVDSLPGIDLRHEVALSRDVLPDGPRAASSRATILHETSTRVEVDAVLDAPGYLMLTDLWYPGWTATIGDQEATVLMANGVFRAVALPAGRHRVVLAYRPRGLVIGALLTAVTLLCLAWRLSNISATRMTHWTPSSVTIRRVAAVEANALAHHND